MATVPNHLVIHVSVSLPEDFDIARLDRWLEGAVEVVVEPEPPPLPGVDARMAPLLWRGLLVARDYLQAARVPVFDAPAILALAPDSGQPGHWRLSAALPRVDQIPIEAYSLAFRGGLDTCRHATRLGDAPEETAVLLAAIAGQVIEPLRGMVPTGLSAVQVLRAAHRLQIPSFHLGGDVHQLGWGCRARLIDRSSSTRDSALGARVAGDKRLAAVFLRQAGLPAPVHESARAADEARAAAGRLGYPLVVKPVDCDRGEGVTVGVAGLPALEAAVAVALDASPSRRVLVERMVPGVCHRVFVAGGRLLYAVRRLPLSVMGDGRRTVADLVAAAQACELARPPWRRERSFALDPLAEESLAAAGLAAGAVPAAGAWAPLRPIESTAWGGCDEDVGAAIHPENVRIALRAAEVLGLEVAGIDIISADIARPWHENAAVITEVNFAPLLGGGAISRSHLERYLRGLVEGDGRIPVEVFVGGAAALDAAVRRRLELASSGVPAPLTSHDRSLDAAGRPLQLALESCFARCRALLMDRGAEALVLVVQTDEFLQLGLPVDRITSLAVIDRRLGRRDAPGEPALDSDIDGMIERLERALAG